MSAVRSPVRAVVRGIIAVVSVASLLTACASPTAPVARACGGGTTAGSSGCS
jgi:hypothetical protein